MRAQLVADLEKSGALELAGITVRPYAKNVDALEGPVVMVSVVQVRPSVVANPQALRDYDVHLDLISPVTDPDGPADDALDDALEVVLDVLDDPEENVAGIVWKDATRAVWGDAAFPSYRITGTATTTTERP